MRWWQRLANGSILIGGGGLAFHAFHGPEHWICLGAAALLTLGGSVVSLLPREKPCCTFHDDLHDEVEFPEPK